MTAATVIGFEGVVWRPSAPAAPPLRVATRARPARHLVAAVLAAFCAFALLLGASPHASTISSSFSESGVAARTDLTATGVGFGSPETPVFVGGNGVYAYDGVSGCCVAPSSSTVYRVQGGVPPVASQTRIGIGSAGEMTVSGDGMLFVTIDDLGRAQAFAANNRPGASIIAFDVDPAFVTQVRNAAVPQSQARNFPGAPQIADPLQTTGSFGLPAAWIQRLQDAAIPGTGRAVG